MRVRLRVTVLHSSLFFFLLPRLFTHFFFFFFLVPHQVSNHLPFPYLSLTRFSSTPLHYEVQLRFTRSKLILFDLTRLHCKKSTLQCLMHAACCTKICIAFVGQKHRDKVYIEGEWVFGGICRETKACFFIVVGQRDKDTLLAIIHAHKLPGTNAMSDMWRALIWLPKTQVRTPSTLKILGGESNKVCLVQEHTKISSKAIYMNGCGSSTMEMILLDTLSSISPTCKKYAKIPKLFVVLLYALLVICSPLHGRKKQNTLQFYCMGLNLRKEIKGRKCGATRSR